ncbi:unnamed protein product [Diatraea saccharalis]|uniref:RNB domain-containing protein n=1 Tax=Diatraea saccharalis TaxID=40085 RepID=A0A9N9WI13_9NEOP|nr:unnamed protein product [Diatraea saccharalis]
MPNLHDSLSERNVDSSGPSTSHVSTSQPVVRSKSVNGKSKACKVLPSKKPTKNFVTSRQKQDGNNMGNKTESNVADNEIASQCQNLNLSDERDEVDQGDNQVIPKRKNAKKKERLKRLSMPTADSVQVPETAHNTDTSSNYVLNDMMPVQEYFMKCITPMYAAASSRFLENLNFHPQFQFLRHSMSVSASVPNTPLLHHSISYNTQSSSNSTPIVQSAPNTPKFIQNAIHHPLLSFSLQNHNNILKYVPPRSMFETGQEDKYHNSPKNKRKNKKKQGTSEDKNFDNYLAENEVDIGIRNNTLIEGVLRINPKQFQHSYVSNNDRSEQDILIDGLKNRNRALEGDIVVVQLIENCDNDIDNNKQKKGKVVHIKEKIHTRTCIGNLKLTADKNRQKALFVPRDHRIPRLNIPFTCWPDNFYQDSEKYENTLFLAKIEDWYDVRFAIGKIICNIGQSGDMITETRAILAQNDLDITPFGSEVRDLYPRLDYSIPENEIKKREDCRKLCVFSIDPPNCRDIDDAVSCRLLENGNYEIGVHISDVAHFLTEDTLLDEKVADKATTIYLVERAYHMLPDDLCMLCSLFPGVDKLAFSVFWEISEDAEVLNQRFSKTVIHSCCQLAYDHAQAILEDRENAQTIFPETYNGFEYKNIYDVIKILGKIAAKFRKQRFDSGALRIDQPKVSFQLNASNGLPESFWLYENKESHQLIEEFMLLANMTVAKKIYDDYPKLAFLRCHPPPSGFMLKQLVKSLQPMGINLEISSAGDLHSSLMQYVTTEDKGRAMVLNMLCAKPMARAKYFCAHGCDDDDFQHYALNVPLYTHFTSPIRRYADIMVHRLLAASIKFRDAPDWEVDKVRMIAAQCNKQKYNAKKAGEMSTELYMLKYIELNSPVMTDAVVVEVREKYIDTIVVPMGLNRRIFFNNDFPGEYLCIKNEAGAKLSKMELTWKPVDHLPEIKQTIEVFSILKIELVKGDDMVKVETKLVRPQ